MTILPSAETKNKHWDIFISYRRKDGTRLAEWLITKIRKFRLPEKILDSISNEKKKLYRRQPAIFKDTSYEKAAEDWLETVFEAVDRSDRLIVISTKSASETITKVNRVEPNWLVREVNRFLGDIPCEVSELSNANSITLKAKEKIRDDLIYTNLPGVKPGYADLGPSFRYIAKENSTGPVSLNFSGMGARPAYKSDRVSMMDAGDSVAGKMYHAIFSSALNSGNGGFVVTELRPVNVIVAPGADTEQFPGWLSDDEKPRRNWIDFQKFGWRHVFGIGSDLDEAVAKLIGGIYDVPQEKMPGLLEVERKQRRQMLWRYVATSIATSTAAAALVAIVSYGTFDSFTQWNDLDRRIDDVQTSINDKKFEQGIRVALQGLPADRRPFWRPGWSAPEVRKLLAKLAGAAEFSAYLHQLQIGNCPVQGAQFSPDGTRIVTASQGGTVTVWNSETLAEIATCNQKRAFGDNKVTQSCDSPEWVRDSRFVGDASTILSVGPYGAWLWKLNSFDSRTNESGDSCRNIIRLEDGHSKAVRTGAPSPDLKSVVTTSDDGMVKVWNLEARTHETLELPKSVLPAEYSYTTDAEFSPDGKSIAVSRRDGLIAIVNRESGVRRALQESGAAVWSIRFDSDGKRLVSASENGEVIVWDIAHSDAKIPLPRHRSAVSSADFSPDGRLIVTASLDQVVRVWDTEKLTQLFELNGHRGAVLRASFSPDGKRIVTSSDDKTARIWSTNFIPSVVRASQYAIKSAAISADGENFVVGGFDRQIIVYKIGDGGTLSKPRVLKADAGVVTSVAFGPDGNNGILATDAGVVKRWSAGAENAEQFFSLPRQFSGLPHEDSFAAINPKGDLVTTASSVNDEQNNDRYNRVWNLESGASWPLEGAHSITSIEFSRDGTRVLAGSEAATTEDKRLATVWDAKTGKKKLELKHMAKVLSAHFSKDGSRIATGSLDYKAHVWDAVTGKELQVFNGDNYDVKSTRFSPDGERIVTASSDRTVRVWDAQTGTQMLQFEIGIDANDAFFTDDGGHILVVTEEGEILTYDVAWTARLDRNLKSRVCKEKLSGIEVTGSCS
jgi:WD40 repeat protein